MERSTAGVTALLHSWQGGDQGAGQELMTLLYQELRRLAGHYFRSERPGHTLQPTAIVHELYLYFFSIAPLAIKDRGHFMALAARQLRRLLVDHARSRGASKRGGIRVDLRVADLEVAGTGDGDFDALDEALTRLEQLDERSARVVELRYFGGFTESEVAEALDISVATVKRDWDFARSWILARMGE